MRRVPWVLALALLVLPAPRPVAAEDFPKVAPFSAVRWKGDTPEVEVAGRWYGLLAIDGTQVGDIVASCRAKYGEKWDKRFEEDLPEVMAGLGKRVGDAVALRVKDLESGAEKTLDGVAMTKENRSRLRAARQARAGPAPRGSGPVERVKREHAAKPSGDFASLVTRHESGPVVPAGAAAEDLDQLEWLLRERYSYARRLGFDYPAALDAIRAALGDGITSGALAIQLQRLMARFGDGHSGVDGFERHLPAGFAPFLVEHAQKGPVAYAPDRSGLVDDARPYLVAIDGVPLAKWVEASRLTVARGAEHYVRHRAHRGLRWIAYLRAEMGLPASATVRLEVAQEGGKSPRTLELPIAARRPTFGEWPRGGSRVLDGGVGYLRIASMDDDDASIRALVDSMESMKQTRSLVIDVRGNGGGSRKPLAVLFPYFLRRNDPPRIASVAAYRLGPGEPPDAADGYLANRLLWPLGWRSWSERARGELDALSKRFRPEWPLPPGEFSAWHYFVLERPSRSARDEASSRDPFVYEKPFVVLLDSACFSATDIFLGAFKGHRGATLVGSPSGGGSGRKETYRLANSGIEVELSSMASFQADGTLYDGRGVEPDVRLDPQPGDFVGRGDSVLDEAIRRLR